MNIIHVILILILSTFSFQSCLLAQDSCSILINGKELKFPLDAKEAMSNFDFEYNSEFKIFSNNSNTENDIFIFSIMRLKENKNSSPILEWRKQEEDFYKYDVHSFNGFIKGSLVESKNKAEELINLKFGNRKEIMVNDELKEYLIGHYKNCITIILYRSLKSTSNISNFIIKETIKHDDKKIEDLLKQY